LVAGVTLFGIQPEGGFLVTQSTQFDIEIRAIDSIRPYEQNLRKNDSAVAAVAAKPRRRRRVSAGNREAARRRMSQLWQQKLTPGRLQRPQMAA
jgi:hypothetical protein